MTEITHDDAVIILKSVKGEAVLKVEKNAINATSQLTTDEEDVVSLYTLTLVLVPVS